MASYYGSDGSKSIFSSGSLFGSRRRTREDVDPMTSMSGVGDVMLVFACGLMIALVTAWSVDLGQFSQVDIGEEVQDVETSEQGSPDSDGNYIEMGKVYMDAETGQYYLVEEE